MSIPLLLALVAAAPAGEQAPHVRVASIYDLPLPLPAPYDASVDASGQLRAALARAKASGKPLLIDFGANWCVECRVLAGVLAIPELNQFVARNFEFVQVDVGQFDRNLDLPARFGGAKLEAIPSVFVVDARTGKLRNAGNVLALGDASSMKPQAIADWLAKWTR